MRLARWLMADPLNPELPLSAGERFFLIQDAKFNATFSRRVWRWTAGLLIPFLALMAVALLALARHRVTLAAVIFALSIGMVIVGAYALSRRVYAPFAWREARRKGFDVCVHCGYWLRGLGGDVKQCPECGAEREPMRRENNREPDAARQAAGMS